MVSNPFPPAAGWGSDTGAFNPDIFHKEALYFLRQISIVDDITSSAYSGEIQNYGDTVHIRMQPDVTVEAWNPGKTLNYRPIVGDKFTLIIDKANDYAFADDDLQRKQADIDYVALVADAAAFRLKDAYDKDILQFMIDSVPAGNTEGTAGTPVTIGFGTGNDFTPLDIVNRLNKILTKANAPSTGRYMIVSPDFVEALGREDSKLVEVQVTGDPQSLIREKGMLARPIHGFTIFETNNLPLDTSGNPVILAGHVEAVATAQQLLQHESMKNPNAFGNLHRGLHVYGRQVIRPSILALAHLDIGDVQAE